MDFLSSNGGDAMMGDVIVTSVCGSGRALEGKVRSSIHGVPLILRPFKLRQHLQQAERLTML